MTIDRKASATVYLMEELGDARLRCDQLIRYLADVTKLVEQSEQRDHFFEVAGHLIREIPETAFKLQKALQAVSLAAGRIDYEELKQELRPEKVEELERVLKDVRIRPVQRRSQPSGDVMKPQQVAAKLREIANKTRKIGSVPVEDLVGVIRAISSDRVVQASIQVDPADVLDRLATTLETVPGSNRDQLAEVLTRLAKDVAFTDIAKQSAALDGTPHQNAVAISERILENAKVSFRFMAGNKVKSSLATLGVLVDEVGTLLVHLGSTDASTKADILSREVTATRIGSPAKLARYEEGKPADPTENMTPEDAETWEGYNDEYEDKFKAAGSEDDEKLSKFEEGKPADPTENMSEADANKWRVEHLKNKDNFKEASDSFWKAV